MTNSEDAPAATGSDAKGPAPSEPEAGELREPAEDSWGSRGASAPRSFPDAGGEGAHSFPDDHGERSAEADAAPRASRAPLVVMRPVVVDTRARTPIRVEAADEDALPGLTAIGPAVSERKIRDWALVLQSMSIWHVIRRPYAGWVLLVRDEDYVAASTSIDRYEAENRDWPPPPTRERPRHAASPMIPAIFAALVAFFLVTGPDRPGSPWFARGVAVSSLVLSSEPWRAVTALTLHADSTHVLGNAVSGAVFVSLVQRRLGAGGAALAVLASGILGNVANAVYHRLSGGDHGSLGASTAVFGAIGLLAATQVVLHRSEPKQTRSWLSIAAPIIGGFALLGALGSGSGDGRTDLGAHLFGFLAGVGIGLVAAIPLRRATATVDFASSRRGHDVALGAGTPRWWVQALLGASAAAIVIASWAAALHR